MERDVEQVKKPYEIFSVNKNECIIVSTGYISALAQIVELELDLSETGYTGTVLFDLLLSNGYARNRFIEMDFDGKSFDKRNARMVEEVSEPNQAELYRFYYANPADVDNSILANAQKYLLKRNVFGQESRQE